MVRPTVIGQYDSWACLVKWNRLKKLGVSHSDVTVAQMGLYKAFAKTGEKLTWDAMAKIETQALVKGGMKESMAQNTVATAINALQKAGVKEPTRIPWGGR
jgi:hypothetical protein